MCRLFFISLLCFIPLFILAQVKPSEGAKLNYRIIGFSLPFVPTADKYGIQVAQGNYNNEDSFQKNIVSTVSNGKNRIIAEVPYFGCNYTWRSYYTDANSKTTNSRLHHFSVGIIPQVDTDSTRLHIIVPPEKNKGDYVFIDGEKALYDMYGHPVWYLPGKQVIDRPFFRPRDLKYNSSGTITYMINDQLYEVGYGGNVLWEGPDNTEKPRGHGRPKIENLYHHELTKLANGHYMVLGMEETSWEIPLPVDTTLKVFSTPKVKRDSIDHKLYQQILTGRIVEFDRKGNTVWTWSSSDYLKKSDLYSRLRKNGLFNLENTHENAFYFDENKKVIYLSFRNLNRILKIEYPSGKVLQTYGTLYEPGDEELNNDMFCGQHSCRLSLDGHLYVYNNNTCNWGCRLPTIVMMKETPSGTHLEKVWEYECSIEGMNENDQKKLRFESGGNVIELPDRSIFCCMGTTYSSIFIVDRDKRILWSAVPEILLKNTKKWKESQTYRASIITRAQLESLIWGEPLKK